VREDGREAVADAVQRARIEEPLDDHEAIAPVLLDLGCARLGHQRNANALWQQLRTSRHHWHMADRHPNRSRLGSIVYGLDFSLIQSSASSVSMNALFIDRLPFTTTTAPQ
jgi:hypothetical protein